MAHIHEKIDFTASAYIVYKNTVLLRKHDKYGAWLDVGGHIEPDEDPNQAVLREVKEEVGLDVILAGKIRTFDNDSETELIPPRFLNRHRINTTHEHIDLVYFATSTTNIIRETDGREKSEEIRWFTKEELLDPKLQIWERVRYYALTALEEIAGK
ncbi:MAG: NUDIX domain-containing protein [Patescibacteria group bacterium]|nr:NUDIX domain-containing protein [Patescibacteria group bacterium]